MCFCNQSLGCLSRFYPDWVWYPPVGLDAWCGKRPPWESPEQNPRIRCGHQRCVPWLPVGSLNEFRARLKKCVFSNDGLKQHWWLPYFWDITGLFILFAICKTETLWHSASLDRDTHTHIYIYPAPLGSWNLLTSLDPFPRFIGSNPGHLHSVEVFQRIQQHWLSPAGVLLVNFVGISAGPREAVNLYGSQLEAQIKPNMIKHHRFS